MVKVDWEVMVTDAGEPVVKFPSTSAGPLASVPEGPVTVQLVTWEALQEIDEEPPLETRSGSAAIFARGERTATLSLSVASGGLPGPVQVMLKLVGFCVSAPVETPAGGLWVAPPVENPVPVQEVAFVELQRRMVDCPWSTTGSSAKSETVGTGSPSDVPAALEHPGSAGKSISPSPSLSAPSEHAAAAGADIVTVYDVQPDVPPLLSTARALKIAV